jgi:hypothetical protein
VTLEEPPKSVSSSLQKSSPDSRKTQLLVTGVCFVLLLGGIGALLGILLPKHLQDDESGSTSSSSQNLKSENSPKDYNNTTLISSYNYTSLDPPDDRDGGFFADPLAEALHDGYRDVLEGGMVLAWKQSLQQQNSVHRVILDMESPQEVSEVEIYGVVLERWGLNAPISLRLQLMDSEGASIYDSLLFTSVETENEWMGTFMPSVIGSEGRLVKRVLLDVTCPRSEERIDTLNKNMRCGISEVDFL